VLATFVGPREVARECARRPRPRPWLAYFMRVGPRSPTAPAGTPSIVTGGDDECARRQWFEAVFGSDGDREALVEDVLDEADDEQTLFEDRDTWSHGLDAVEDLGTREEPPMKDLLALHDRLLAWQGTHGPAHYSRLRGRGATVPANPRLERRIDEQRVSWRDASITSLGVAAKLGVRLCLTTEPSENTVTEGWWCASRFTNCTLRSWRARSMRPTRPRCSSSSGSTERGLSRTLRPRRRTLAKNSFTCCLDAAETPNCRWSTK